MSCLSALVRLSRQTEHTHCTEGQERWVPQWAIVDHQPAALAGKESAARVICTESSARRPHTSHPPALRPLKAPVSILTDLTDLIASLLDPPSRQKKKYEILDILANEPRPPFQRSKAGPLGRPKFPRRHQRRESQSSGRRAARPTFVPRRSNQRTWRETFFLEQEKSALSDWGLSSFFQARLPFGRRSFLGLARDIHEVVEPVMEGSCEMRRGNNHGHEVHNSPIVGQQNSPSATRLFFFFS